jgi:D-beta-D-heptose 7-phosphate kinase/D-beta-D-heptose 1-phosphate adenosyltransferase
MDRNVVDSFAGKSVLVIGDLMLDRFIYGTVNRISPEAPIPILRFTEETVMLGGAGNVARNIAALGGRASLVAVVGTDHNGEFLRDSLCAAAGIEAAILSSPETPTTVKTRFVSDGQQILRLDREFPHIDTETLDLSIRRVEEIAPSVDIIVLSDYAKGVLTETTIRAHLKVAKGLGIPVIVDPKNTDLDRYRGVDFITPNAHEASMATGYDCSTDLGAGRAARSIIERTNVAAAFITRGPQGMTLLAPVHGVDEPLHIATKASSVYDVSGAGDTVMATLALAISAGLDIPTAAEIANFAAGVAVGKFGTAAVTSAELAMALADSERVTVLTREEAIFQTRKWRNAGLSVGLTNGCFDLVHPGHVALLREARNQCDRLVVALNTDASVRRLKGPSRPVQDEHSRAEVIGSLRSVDLVTFFDEDTPLDLIEAIKPDVLIKGADYSVNEVVGNDLVRNWGGRVYLAPLEAGHSTTDIIARSDSNNNRPSSTPQG